MNYKELEEKTEKLVAEFVASLNGRYKEHISDKCLTGLLMMKLSEDYSLDIPNVSRMERMTEGESFAPYGAGCPVFELLLEDKCGVISNGHHVAQNFAKFMSERFNK